VIECAISGSTIAMSDQKIKVLIVGDESAESQRIKSILMDANSGVLDQDIVIVEEPASSELMNSDLVLHINKTEHSECLLPENIESIYSMKPENIEVWNQDYGRGGSRKKGGKFRYRRT